MPLVEKNHAQQWVIIQDIKLVISPHVALHIHPAVQKVRFGHVDILYHWQVDPERPQRLKVLHVLTCFDGFGERGCGVLVYFLQIGFELLWHHDKLWVQVAQRHLVLQAVCEFLPRETQPAELKW